MHAPHINDISRPLILLGTTSNLTKYVEICQILNIPIHGIIDGDYYGNTETFCGVDVIDTEASFNDQQKLDFYRKNFNFFCAVNWTPMTDSMSVRNREKRDRYISLIKGYQLRCISIVAKTGYISPSVAIGKGCFVDNMVHIEPNVVLEDFVRVYGMTHISHDAYVSENCTLQRMCAIPSMSRLGKNSYFSPIAKCVKHGVVFGEGTWVQEGVYLRRGTVPGEVVSLSSGNQRRVYSLGF